MRPRFSERGQDRFDPQPFHESRQIGRTVAGVALQGFGLGAWSASRSSDRWHIDEQAAAQPDRRAYWPASSSPPEECLGRRSAHAAYSRLSHGPSGSAQCAPPKTARTLALSITARSRLIAPALPSCESNQRVQVRPDRQLGPLGKATPASAATAAVHFGRQRLPRDARPQHKHDARERLAIGHPWPSALGRRLGFRRQKWFDLLPQFIPGRLNFSRRMKKARYRKRESSDAGESRCALRLNHRRHKRHSQFGNKKCPPGKPGMKASRNEHLTRPGGTASRVHKQDHACAQTLDDHREKGARPALISKAIGTGPAASTTTPASELSGRTLARAVDTRDSPQAATSSCRLWSRARCDYDCVSDFSRATLFWESFRWAIMPQFSRQ